MCQDLQKYRATLVLALLIHLFCGLAGQSAAEDKVGVSPIALEVTPREIHLGRSRDVTQLLVTARYADGSTRDVTRLCRLTAADPTLVEITPRGTIEARADGQTKLTVQLQQLQSELPLTVTDSQAAQPVSFRREIVPILSSAGCSDIRCHGAPSGKNGFRLSLWGSDADLDYLQLVRDQHGRRTNRLSPGDSLIILKGLTHVSHAGGRRFADDSRESRLLQLWQREGLHDDRDAASVVALEVTPTNRVLHEPARQQQLAVQAVFADGYSVDVTHLTAFRSTDPGVASVDRYGLVEFSGQGETAILCRYAGRFSTVRLMHVALPATTYRWPDPQPKNHVDTHVFAKLKMLHIAPSRLCSDEEFVRRVYLDLCGILPSPEQRSAFLADKSPNKRNRLVDQLLCRPEFADLWAKKWMDVLRASRDSIQLAGSQAYHDWMQQHIAADSSLADVAYALLTSSGESYSDPATNYFCTTPMPKEVTDPIYLQKDLAEATSQLFLGIRLQCAQCHNHPFERWTQQDYLSLAAVFTQVKRSRLGKAGPSGRPDRRQMAIEIDLEAAEIVDEATGQNVLPRGLGELQSEIEPTGDRRQGLADWLVDSENPFFAKAIVNRVWFHLHGRGIVEPVDDFRDSNPAANDELLQALAKEFVASGFRLKPLIRTIVNSRTYQLSSQTNESNQSDFKYFSHMQARPLSAEVLLDAICELTGRPESYEIMQDYIEGIPTESVRMPWGTRAVQLPVNDIVTLINTSGKYVRYESHPFLRTFGQPNRTQTCECDREQGFTRKQALELIVGPMVSAKLAEADNRLGKMLTDESDSRDMLRELYLRALSRLPTPKAEASFLDYVGKAQDKRQAWEDVLWTLLTSQEFVYQH